MKIILLLVLLASLSSCIGSPITVQVAKDVNGDVYQEVGTVDVVETAVPPSPAVEPPERNWFALFVGVGIPTLLGLGLTLHLLSNREGGGSYWDEKDIDEMTPDEYEIFIDWVKKNKY